MRERAAAVWSFALVLFAGCHSQPIAPPETAPAANDEIAALGERVRALEAERMLFVQLLAGQSSVPAPEPTAVLEQNALLARIAAGLEGLRDANAARGKAQPADAASARTPLADEAAVMAMQRALQTVEQQRSLLLENLVNVNTPGYRRRSLRMSTELQAGTGIELPVARGVTTKDSTGTLEITERTLDVAIDGRGFYAVRLPDERIAYSRAGSLHVAPNGQLVLGDGAVLQPPITIPADTLDLSIDPEGRVTVRTASKPDLAAQLGQIVLHDFVDGDELQPLGNLLLQPTRTDCRPRTGTPGREGLGLLKQGFLERSNVQLVDELVELSLANRQLGVLRRQLAQFGVFAW